MAEKLSQADQLKLMQMQKNYTDEIKILKDLQAKSSEMLAPLQKVSSQYDENLMVQQVVSLLSKKYFFFFCFLSAVFIFFRWCPLF